MSTGIRRLSFWFFCALYTLSLSWFLLSLLVLVGESIPYQDPTPDMLVQQAESLQFWKMSSIISLVFVVATSLGIWCSRAKK